MTAGVSELVASAPAVPAAVFDPARLAAVRATGLLDSTAEEPFDRLARLAATLLDAPLAFVTVVDERRSFWKSCIGVDTSNPGDRQNAVEQSFCQYVVGTAEPLIVEDAALDPRTRANPSIKSMGVRAWAGYPLLSPDGLVLGTFCVVDTKPRPWTDRDSTVLETLAHAASGEIALRVALQEARQASLVALTYGEQHAQLARTLQESLLPSRLLQVPGLDIAARYLPGGRGTQVIGDFYDVFPSRGDGWGVVVGDVCGHGAAAAAVTALARWSVRSSASRLSSPRRVLKALNSMMLERAEISPADESERFLTAAYLTLRPDAGGFAGLVCNGGHTPVLRRRAGGEIDTLGRGGMLLGALPDPPLKDFSFRLAAGDSLVLYTDGVTEARSRRGNEQFGDQRLAELVSAAPRPDAASLAEDIEAAVLSHTHGEVLDDTAIVVLAVT